MQDRAVRIRDLIASDDLDQALVELQQLAEGSNQDIRREVISLRQRLSTARKSRRAGLATPAEETRSRIELGDSILQVLAEMVPEGRESTFNQASASIPESPVVFVSYSHVDREVADRLGTALEAHGIAIRIDYRDGRAGESITALIERCVRNSTVTLSIVSVEGLLSAWVAMESLKTFALERPESAPKFIAVYLDPDFFDPAYRLRTTRIINDRLDRIEALIREYTIERLDTNDLNDEKTRLFELRNNLGTILARLRNSLTLPVDSAQFETTAARVVAAVRDSAQPGAARNRFREF